MAKILKPDGTESTEAAAIQAFFGRKEGQTLTEFMQEVRALSPESKTELAVGAAQQLGWTVQP